MSKSIEILVSLNYINSNVKKEMMTFSSFIPKLLTVKMLSLLHQKLAALFPLSLQKLLQTLREGGWLVASCQVATIGILYERKEALKNGLPK